MPEKVHRCVEKLMAEKNYSKEKAIKICQVSTGQSYNTQESVELREISLPTGFKVDRENGVIRDVRVLGPTSRNGYQYSPQAIAAGRGLYEGIVVNFDHPPRHNSSRATPIADRAGWIENPREEKGGVTADVYLLKADPRSDKVFEAAERRPELFGLSHNIEAKTRRENGRTIVEEIKRVRSVDVVSDPATTRSLFESIEQEEAKMAVTITEFLDAVEEDNPKATVLREIVETGLVANDSEVDEELGGKLKTMLETKPPEKKEPEKKEPEKKDSGDDDKLAKILENQESFQTQLTEMKGRMNITKTRGGQRITESNGTTGKKSENAKEFMESITGR